MKNNSLSGAAKRMFVLLGCLFACQARAGSGGPHSLVNTMPLTQVTGLNDDHGDLVICSSRKSHSLVPGRMVRGQSFLLLQGRWRKSGDLDKCERLVYLAPRQSIKTSSISLSYQDDIWVDDYESPGDVNAGVTSIALRSPYASRHVYAAQYLDNSICQYEKCQPLASRICLGYFPLDIGVVRSRTHVALLFNVQRQKLNGHMLYMTTPEYLLGVPRDTSFVIGLLRVSVQDGRPGGDITSILTMAFANTATICKR